MVAPNPLFTSAEYGSKSRLRNVSFLSEDLQPFVSRYAGNERQPFSICTLPGGDYLLDSAGDGGWTQWDVRGNKATIEEAMRRYLSEKKILVRGVRPFSSDVQTRVNPLTVDSSQSSAGTATQLPSWAPFAVGGVVIAAIAASWAAWRRA